MIVSITEIAERGNIASRDELEALWLQYVDPKTNKAVLRLLSDRELRRMIVIGVAQKNKRHWAFGRAMLQVGKAVGLSASTCYSVWREAKAKLK